MMFLYTETSCLKYSGLQNIAATFIRPGTGAAWHWWQRHGTAAWILSDKNT